MRRPTRLLPLLLALAACDGPMPLPSAPQPPAPGVRPTVTVLEPASAFSDEFIDVVGTGFDPVPSNNVVLFAGGFVATPESDSTTTRLRVTVPTEATSGYVRVQTPSGTSDVPETGGEPLYFTALGYGHPIQGTGVADLRFRHRPVGLVNIEPLILVGSSLFDAVLDDSGRFAWVTGRPTVVQRLPEEQAFLATRAPDGGHVMRIDVASGEIRGESAPSPRVEQFVLAPTVTGPLVATTIGFDANGVPYLTRWKQEASVLMPVAPPAPVALAEVFGAAMHDGQVYVVGTQFIADVPVKVVARVHDDGAVTVRWRQEPEAVPAGPLAIVTLAGGPAAIVGLSDGDLLTVPLAGGPADRSRMISFSPAHSIVPSRLPGHVLVSKPRDGAIYEYDMNVGEFTWSAQLRGEPTFIDVAYGLGEISVANAEDNDIDVLMLSDGRWKGRSSISLGLGSADGGPGGIVGPYSYDPLVQPRDANFQPIMHLLARNAPLIIELDAGELGIRRQYKLDGDISRPVRLVVTPDLKTMVIHRTALGLVEDPIERIVARDLPTEPLGVTFLRDGRALVHSSSTVDLYAWREGLLERKGGLQVPPGSFVTGVVSHKARRPGVDAYGDGGKDVVLVTWRGAAGSGGALFDPARILDGITTGTPVRLPAGATDQTGAVDLLDGPAAIFSRSLKADGTAFGPALLSYAYLRGDADALVLPGMTTAPTVLEATPDGRCLTWVTEGAGEYVARVLTYEPGDALYPWTGYRQSARPAGPATDPSGEWLYIPVPKLDLLSVVQ